MTPVDAQRCTSLLDSWYNNWICCTRSHKIKNVSSFLFHAVEMAAPLRGLLDGGPQCGPQHPQCPQRPSVCTIIFARTDPNQVPDHKMERKGANEEISYEDLEG